MPCLDNQIQNSRRSIRQHSIRVLPAHRGCRGWLRLVELATLFNAVASKPAILVELNTNRLVEASTRMMRRPTMFLAFYDIATGRHNKR